jgi:rod shape-determining protein MreD
MHWPRFALLALIAALLQASFVDTIAVTRLGVKPDLLLILMVFFATRCTISEAIISSFALGFLADIIATGFPIGPWVISFGVLGTALAYMHRVIVTRKMLHEAIIIFIVGFGAGVLAILLTALAGQRPRTGSFGVVVGSAIYSAVLGPFLFLFLGWLMRIRNRRHHKE